MFRRVHAKFKDALDSVTVLLHRGDYIAIRDGTRHSQPHPEIETHFALVRAAIEAPYRINSDRVRPNTDCYYAVFSGDQLYPAGYMKVVVRKAYYAKVVITAYFVSQISMAETRVWPIKTNK